MMSYHTDQPLESSDGDLFDRTKFAGNIAKVICSQPTNEKYVIGLYSPWGYGKSSVLNMMQADLKQKGALVVPFNPWVYTDLRSMTAGLLAEIAKKVNDADLGYDKERPTERRKQIERWIRRRFRMAKTKGYRNTIASSIGSIAEATSLSAEGISVGKSVAAAARSASRDSFITLKKNVEHSIKLLSKRVVVVIDDVDRLDREEVFQLFKLVKAVADFKGITYVIAFDNIAVAKALNGRFSADNDSRAGVDFLEKIIQIPLSLPYIPREELKDMLLRDLNSLLDEYKLEISDYDADRFWDVFDEHIMPHLKTPRAIKRYLNLLTFTLPLSGKEVNAVDSMILSALKLLYPATYDRIQAEKLLLTGNNTDFFMDDDAHNKKIKKKLEALAEGEDGASSILSSLFPAIQKAYGGSPSWEDSAEKVNEDKRVASLDYFDRYFIFGIGKSDISDEEIKRILEATGYTEIFTSLKMLATNSVTQKMILTKIRKYKNLITEPSPLLKALVNSIDFLSSAQGAGFFDRGGMEVLSSTIVKILKAKSANKLKDISMIMRSCDNSDLLTYIIRDINLAAEKKDDTSPLLTDEEFAIFKDLAVKKIELMARNTRFYAAPHKASYHLYAYWQEYAEDNAVDIHLKKILTSGNDVLDFLTCYLATWTGSQSSRRGDFTHASYDAIKKLVSPSFLYKRLLEDDGELEKVRTFVDLEHNNDDPDLSKVGNEGSSKFRKILAQEFAFIHFQEVKATKENADAR